jgi:hypothetical protein
MPEQQRGLSEVAPSRNGNRLEQDHSYGFMGSVSPPTLTLLQGLMVSFPDSGRRKKRPLVC